MPAQALMVLGTASHVGKSLMTAALCRLLARRGLRVAPFKAQNMSLNSAATLDGDEIGRAQALQAEAAGVRATADMNPILLKPSSDTSCQIIVRGRVWGQANASDYHGRLVEALFPTVVESYRRVAAAHDVVVLEGAGSPVEINLKAGDLVNMRMAEAADATCVLVADIDRGGVFASLVGTFALFTPTERARVRGFLVNKFRGDVTLLRSGIDYLEQRLERPCLGVVPFLHAHGLEEEDSVAVPDQRRPRSAWTDAEGADRPLRVAVVAYPYLSNFTDCDALCAEPSLAVTFVTAPAELDRADLVILPGSKETIHDLGWLRRSGLAAALHAHHARGGLVIGLCGGMQMLGLGIRDPEGMEGGGEAAGLGLLPFHTVLAREKVTVKARGSLVTRRLFGHPIENRVADGYEIHLGTTEPSDGLRPCFDLTREGSPAPVADGAVSGDERVLATYLHGLFDRDDFRHGLVRAARAACGLHPPRDLSHFTAERTARLDRLADHVGAAIRLDTVLEWLEAPQ